jgi:hypothetical protein
MEDGEQRKRDNTIAVFGLQKQQRWIHVQIKAA